jgi:uncharacterized Fe-S cluster-containing radical SAM superfamily protein
MLPFNDLLKGFKDNFSASIAAVMVLAIFGLSGYVVQLHEKINGIGSERLKYQVECANEVRKCDQFWRARMDSLQRAELEKTQKQVNELNDLLKQLKR